jgi:hypothetical protein
VAEWQTRRSQKPLGGNPRVGSTPTFGTSNRDERTEDDMISIICPKCNAESKLSFVGNSYDGPRRCWKCHELFMVRIKNDTLISCEPLSQEDFEKQQEINALKNKFRKQ